MYNHCYIIFNLMAETFYQTSFNQRLFQINIERLDRYLFKYCIIDFYVLNFLKMSMYIKILRFS
jgi:hypothetical protein